MVKLRLATIDAKAAIDEVRAAAVGKRLLNVYDLSPRVYLFKFGQGEQKVYVLFEAGVRLHVTTFSREKPKVPSQFTLKLRKHVRSWRLEAIDQLGTDRVVDLRFGSDDQAHHFVLELYGQGNFFLTDAKYTILMLLRSAKSEDVRLAVRETYPTSHAKTLTCANRESIVEALTQAKESDTLRACLPMSVYGSLLADHMLASCGLNPNERKKSWGDDIQRIADSVFGVCQCVDALLLSDSLVGGGLLVKLGTLDEVRLARKREAAEKLQQDSPPAAASPSSVSSSPVLTSSSAIPSTSVPTPDEFWPLGIEPYLDRSRVVAVERLPTFSEAADRCFQQSEQEKISQHNTKKEQAVLSKKEKFLRDHQRRIDGLTQECERNRRLGDLIITHVDEVDAAIRLVNDVLATGMSWDNLGSLIRLRQSEGTHPVANIIHELKLYKNTISLLLSQDCDDDDEVEDADLEPIVVDVDIGLSAYANAAKFHGQKKAVQTKLAKTIDATDKAAEAAERSGERAAKKVIAKRDITTLRQPMWFEKFQWFLTSFGHIVVSGHDAMQADLLFKRYLSPGDIWVHGDSVGCLPVLVKNPRFGKVPMASIEEAGIMCMSRTDAWRKAPTSAWWCLATQVSKRTATGEHLGLGQFSVRGTKNYMPAMQLQLAVGILFRTDARRPPREISGVPTVNVGEVWSEQQQQESAENDARAATRGGASGGAGGRSAASNADSAAGPTTGANSDNDGDDEEEGTTAEDRGTSGDLTEDATGSPNQSQEPGAFPSGTDDVRAVDGPPLAAQLHLQQQQATAAVDKRSKLRHLKRGQSSSAASVTPADSESDAKTISIASTQTLSVANSRGKGGGLTPQAAAGGLPAASPTTPTVGDVLTNTNLSSRAQTKLKKIRKKYAGQDEEDRQRAMALHGNTVSKIHQVLIQAETTADIVEPTTPAAAAAGGGGGRVRFADDVDDNNAAGNANGGNESSGDDDIARKFGDDAMRREHEEMNRRASSFEDDTAKAVDRMQEEFADIVPFLDGAPVIDATTNVQDAVVVCAPLASLRHYLFKARIAPGTDKKGQAARGVIDAFETQVPKALPHAKPALAFLSLENLIAQLVGPLKVHLSDLTAPVTSAGGASSSIAADGGEQSGDTSGMSVRQRQKLKKDELEKQMMERLRAERRARLEARGGSDSKHSDPIAA